MAIQNLITELFNDLSSVIEGQIGSTVSSITTSIAPVMGAALCVYVVYITYKIIYTNNEVFMSEIIKNVMSLALVSAFAASTPYYMQYVVPSKLSLYSSLVFLLFSKLAFLFQL